MSSLFEFPGSLFLDVLNKILRTCSIETRCSVVQFDFVVLRRGYLIGARAQEELHRCTLRPPCICSS